MKLQRRNLSTDSRGDNVRLLHQELRLLGFRIPVSEARPGVFGPKTEAAVRKLQEQAGLKVTGIVNRATARAINAQIEGRSGEGADLESTSQQQTPIPEVGGGKGDDTTPPPAPPASLRQKVLAVADAKDRSLTELRGTNLELFRRLEARVAAERKAFVLASFENSSQVVRDKLETIDFSLGGQPQRSLKEVILTGLQAQPAMDSRMAEEANTRLLELERAGQLNDPAAVDLPLRAHPLFQKDLQQAEVFRLAGLTALPDPKVEKLLTRTDSLATLRDETLKGLVDERELTQDEARKLGLSASLHRIAGGQQNVAEVLVRSTFPSLPGDKKVSRLQDLLALDVAAWEDVLRRAGVGAESSAVLDRRADAEQLRHKVTQLFPTEAFLQGNPPFRKPDLVTRVAQANPKAELLTLDLSTDSDDLAGLRFPDGLSEADRKAVLADVKSAQRAYALTGDVDDARTLLAKRYDSALAVAGLPLETFQQEAGLPPSKARAVHEAAQAKVTALTLATSSVLDIARGGFSNLQVSNVSPDINDFLKKIPGFAELFGSQAYCRCEHCQSVLGPAAYFVDLMRFVETNILGPIFTGARSTHPLNLKVRRPDLWMLPLTCENIDTLVPYLDIINEILENRIAQQPGFTGNLGDRAAVEDYVYTRRLVVADSFRRPFVLPQVQLDAYLAAHESSRATVARTLAAAPSALAAAVLRTSQREIDLITQKNETLSFLQTFYVKSFSVGTDGKIVPFDVQELLLHTGLSRAELGETVTTFFVVGSGLGIVIQSEKLTADSVQNDVERIHGLDPGSLDRLHRFTRLQRRLPWSTAELDLVLSQIKQAGLATELDATALGHLVAVLALEERWKLAIPENCALWSEIPQRPLGGPSLFDRLFNLPPFARLDGPLPKNDVKLIHPAFRASGTPLPADHTLGRLLAGLRVNEDQLAQLIRQLAVPLGNIKPDDPDEAKRGFLLTAGNLTLLYRHARLAELLKLTVAELFQLIGQAGFGAGHVANLDQLGKLLDYHDAWKGSGFKLDDVGFVTRGLVREPGTYPDKQRLAEDIVRDLKERKSFELADTVFAFLPGVTEELSRQIVKDNPVAIEPIPNSSVFCVTPGFGPPTALTVPAGLEPKVREVLLQYHTSRVLPLQLGQRLALPADKVAALLALTGIDLADANLAKALQGRGPIQPLIDVLDKLLPLAVLFRHPVFDAAALAWMGSHKQIIDVTNWNPLGVTTVRNVALYMAFTQAPEADAAAVRQALAGFNSNARRFADAGVLARALRADAALVATLQPNLTLPATALEALAMLGRCAALARDLGVDGEALKLSLGSNYGDLLRASRAVLGSLRSQFADEAEYLARLEPFEDQVRSRKRDALVDSLLRSFPEFRPPNDLYHHFLIDVQLDGCARTSKVVAALSSVQLYVHRCLMNLEQDRRPDGPDHVRVPPERIRPDQWSWRKNYQVWVANRKVFLNPENYLEPELRDDKTPLFRELESQLLQQQINEETVLDAYANYLSGFEELARLKIAGSYHDVGTDTDLLHLFGVTPSDPPTYYYRTVENARASERNGGRGIVWSPWRKVDVQIPVRRVALIMFQGRLLVFWVEIITTPTNQVTGGESKFTGYKHRLTLKYTTLRLDGSWTAPQTIALNDPHFFTRGDGVVIDVLISGFNPSFPNFERPGHHRLHPEPIESYTLDGFLWDQVYPAIDGERLVIPAYTFSSTFFDGQYPIDFYRKVSGPSERKLSPASSFRALRLVREAGISSLHSTVITHPARELPPAYSYYSILANHMRRGVPEGSPGQFSFSIPEQTNLAIVQANDDIAIVNGAVSDAILDSNGDLLLIQGGLRADATYVLKRIGTTLRDELSRTLFTTGVDGLLALETQKRLQEAPLPIAITPPSPPRTVPFLEDKSNAGKLDFQGAYGGYFREIFFHVPFLIAHQLNSQQRFAAAQRWYHYAFDPTAGEAPLPNPPTDRVWRYLELRNLGVPRLRAILTDTAALEVYQKDPFNPHAIARLRPSAYQKNVVMKYVDNLLDWGDSLFTQFTTESINEATLLYVLAADILGPRPAQLGSCGEGRLSPKSYENIKASLLRGSDFLLEIENLLEASSAAIARGTERVSADLVLDDATVRFFERTEGPATSDALARPYDWKGTRFGTWTTDQGETVGQLDHDSPLIRDLAPLSGFAEGLLSQLVSTDPSSIGSGESSTATRSFSPVFCVPENKELRQYWDRVEDRLFKIRHCLDITGARRQLALFAAEIDPRILVRARAAGLSIEDVLNATSGNLPPYRFTYLIEKARQYAGTVQSFGAALLSALEKRDVEELNRLRNVHQQNLLRLTTRMRELEIDAAQDAITTLERQQAASEYRRSHFQGLLDGGLNTAERVQQVGRHVATVHHGLSAALQLLAGVGFLIPQLGSPFALKYGGVEIGNSAQAFTLLTRNIATVAENVSASAALEAGFQRREEDWNHQIQLAAHEVSQLEKQLTAARLRKEIAERSLTLHQQTVQQEEEIFEFYKDRFTNLGLYTWLSTNLQRLHREAYNSAYAMARLAEQAFRFERNDETSPLLQPQSWDAAKAGLLSGERLLLDLQHIERQFLETNFRSLEIEQSFSLTQIDPAALIHLREKGECTFSLPEVFFDLSYPGQYRRRIRAVRVTIPCVAGPHTNIGATLRLTGSQIRMKPQLDAPMVVVPRRRTVSIATSKAQNDSGVFEFSFRDERYMAFEGAGAVSDWSLTLPKEFRPFDYQTIADVLLHVSYTAEEDDLFRQKVEEQDVAGTILHALTGKGLGRVFSLRQDFSSAFHRLLHSAANTPVPIAITDKHLPLFLQGKKVKVSKARLALKTRPDQTPLKDVVLTLNGIDSGPLNLDAQLGGLRAGDVDLSTGLVKDHVLTVKTAGDLAPAPPRPGDVSAVDAEKLLDVLLYVEYQVDGTAGS